MYRYTYTYQWERDERITATGSVHRDRERCWLYCEGRRIAELFETHDAERLVKQLNDRECVS